MIDYSRLESLLAEFPRLTIGLVGDLFLDRYLEIESGTHELSIETGLEAYQVTRVRNAPGALGTVMNNLAALGVGRLVPITVIGDDGHGDDLMRELKRLPVDASHVMRDAHRLTPTYTKPLKQDDHGMWRELNRLDVKTRGPLSADTSRALCEHVRDAFATVDGLIVLDQFVEENWGVVNSDVRRTLRELCLKYTDKLIYSDSRAHLAKCDFGVLKGNHTEVTSAADIASSDTACAERAAVQLCQRTGKPVFCTLGEIGILVARPQTSAFTVPACKVDGPIDIVGAGDSATAGIVASLLAGADEIEAATIGNLVASITIQQLGTTGTAAPEQVLARRREI